MLNTFLLLEKNLNTVTIESKPKQSQTVWKDQSLALELMHDVLGSREFGKFHFHVSAICSTHSLSHRLRMPPLYTYCCLWWLSMGLHLLQARPPLTEASLFINCLFLLLQGLQPITWHQVSNSLRDPLFLRFPLYPRLHLHQQLCPDLSSGRI